MFENRTYRGLHHKKGLVSFDITVKETNLNIQAQKDLSSVAVHTVLEIRHILETYIELHPNFAESLVPLKEDIMAPRVIQQMMDAGKKAQVGPMAAVAGLVAEFTGTRLLEFSPQVVVENGGDIFIKSDTETIFSIFAGDSPFSMVTGIKIPYRSQAYGLCTSSGTVGHSKSFGTADAVCVLSNSCPLADAVATALGNKIHTSQDIPKAIEAGREISGIQGLVIIKGDEIGAWGNLELVQL